MVRERGRERERETARGRGKENASELTQKRIERREEEIRKKN